MHESSDREKCTGRKASSSPVIGHDAETVRKIFQLPTRRRFRDVKQAKKQKSEKHDQPCSLLGRNNKKYKWHCGKFIKNDGRWVFLSPELP
jgi:hypothetical protein